MSKWTEQQLKAIETSGCNLLVAAAAGSGKTAVLVQRIINKIIDEKDPMDIDKLLVVTFTNAAASEMRERIGEALSKEIEKNPNSKGLQRQLVLLSKSNIMTIHSFCLQVIRGNFQLIDVDPSFRVGDETETLLLKEETLEELFEEKYESRDNNFLQLVDCYADNRSDDKVKSLIMDLYRFSKSSPWYEEWLTASAEEFNVEEDYDFGSTKWAEVLLNNAKVELVGLKNSLSKAVYIIEHSEGLSGYEKAFKEDLININTLIDNSEDWHKFVNTINDIKFSKLGRASKDVDEESKKTVSKIRDEVKKKISSMQQDIFMDISEIPCKLKKMYPVIKTLVNLVIEFDNMYSIKKREKGIIDFNDIEHFCLHILVEKEEDGTIKTTAAAERYKESFKEILIDEYQDSNMVQEVILNSISRESGEKEGWKPNIFMVGDIKQSIYRFRQAKPELFLKKYESYKEEEGELYRKIKLFKNFRSRKEVLDGVNYIFKQVMSREIGELQYSEEEYLNAGADFKDELNPKSKLNPVELHIMDLKADEIKEETDGEEEEDLDKLQVEARMVSNIINDMMKDENFMVFDKGTEKYRKLQYKDIVILMRATEKSSPVFVEELDNKAIPVFADSGSGYFETTEIKIIMSLLQIIDNPLQDIPLLAVLRSPIASFSSEELMDIRLVDKNMQVYHIMKNICEDEEIQSKLNGELVNKIKWFVNKIDGFREKVNYMPLDEFIWHLYSETGFYGYVAAMPGGIQRQANLRILFERAKVFEESSYKGLFNFINFIQKLKSSNGDMGSAKIIGENEDVVRIMSIHKSKGLEFPVVILACCGKQFNMLDLKKNVLFHQDLGIGPDYVDLDKRISYPTIFKEVIKKKTKIETLSEEMRILYVALTRAKERLIMTGVVKNINKAFEKWQNALDEEENIPKFYILGALSYLDWIAPTIMKHEDGESLRETAGILSFKPQIDSSIFKTMLWNKEQIVQKETELQVEEADVIKDLETLRADIKENKYKKDVERILSWQYDYKEASNLPTKITVSELKRRFMEDEEYTINLNGSSKALKKPKFLEEKIKFSKAEIGTLMHYAMQHMDVSKVSTIEEIESQIRAMVKEDFITEEQSKVINAKKIYNFFKSELGKRLMASQRVYREVPFYIEVKSTEIYNELPKEMYDNEYIILQGVIDCYFEEEDGLIILDYKTDYVEEEEEIIERYKIQLYYYEEALRRITGKTVKDKYLYLFHKDKFVKVV